MKKVLELCKGVLKKSMDVLSWVEVHWPVYDFSIVGKAVAGHVLSVGVYARALLCSLAIPDANFTVFSGSPYLVPHPEYTQKCCRPSETFCPNSLPTAGPFAGERVHTGAGELMNEDRSCYSQKGAPGEGTLHGCRTKTVLLKPAFLFTKEGREPLRHAQLLDCTYGSGDVSRRY